MLFFPIELRLLKPSLVCCHFSRKFNRLSWTSAGGYLPEAELKSVQMGKAPESITNWADKKSGAFNRAPSKFRNFISKEPGAEFPPEKGRYHLYVSYACPWGESTVNFGPWRAG